MDEQLKCLRMCSSIAVANFESVFPSLVVQPAVPFIFYPLTSNAGGLLSSTLLWFPTPICAVVLMKVVRNKTKASNWRREELAQQVVRLLGVDMLGNTE